MSWYGDHWDHMGGVGGWIMGIWMIVGIVLLVALTLAVLRGMGVGGGLRATQRGKREDDAVEILRRRYAKGEIDEEELHRRMHELGAQS